jgi:hypothetical protein
MGRQLDARSEPADERQPLQADADEQDQKDRPEEFGDRHHRRGGRVQNMFSRSPAQGKHHKPAADAEHHAEHKAGCDQFQRCRQCGCHQFRDRAAKEDRAAEIAVQQSAEPDPELLEQRSIEPKGLLEFFVIPRGGAGRQRHRHRVGGQQPQDDEDERRHAQQNRDRQQ